MLRSMASLWDDVREDFPALKHSVYLNSAACAPTPRVVRERVAGYLRDLEEGGDASWPQWLEERELVRERVAGLVNASPGEIAFVPNTSTGINLVADLVGPDGPVLSDEIEFPSVTLPWIHRGIAVHFAPVVEGIVRREFFELDQAPRAATIALSHVQFSNGCRQDLTAFGALKGDRHLVVSGSQSVGAFPVDVESMRIDALASAGHKWLCAGYGAGFLYVRSSLLRRRPASAGWMSVRNPFAFDNRRLDLIQEARRVEVGTPAFPGIFALGAAVSYLQGIGIESIAARVLELNGQLTERLEQAGFEVLSPDGAYRSAQTLCAVPESHRAAEFLQENGILVTVKPEGVRISTHFFNCEEELEACVRGLAAFRESLAGKV